MKLVVVWFMVAPDDHRKVVTEIEVTKKGKKFFTKDEFMPSSDDKFALKRKVILASELNKIIGKVDMNSFTANFYGFCNVKDKEDFRNKVATEMHEQLGSIFENIDKMWATVRMYFNNF